MVRLFGPSTSSSPLGIARRGATPVKLGPAIGLRMGVTLCLRHSDPPNRSRGPHMKTSLASVAPGA
jgi:hypothetical protein